MQRRCTTPRRARANVAVKLPAIDVAARLIGANPSNVAPRIKSGACGFSLSLYRKRLLSHSPQRGKALSYGIDSSNPVFKSMDDCCTGKACVLEQLREKQTTTLRAVLLINAVMFCVEFVAGLLAGSVALTADSLDMLGDAIVYAFSLYVVAKSAVWKARAAMVKAAVMALFGLFVLAELTYKVLYPQIPTFEAMGAIAVLALAANSACFGMLWRHRGDDINMRSVWLCSRNDLIANSLVLIAAYAVWALESSWPDIAAGAIICAVFLRSAIIVAREALAELREHRGRFAPS